ncbi:hypothetical protein ES708_30561 [subsurface metagenome]
MKQTNIFIIGAIASGKSTVRQYLVSLFRQKGLKIFIFDIDYILRKILVPSQSANCDFEYTSSGRLILKNPDNQISLAMDILVKECTQAVRRNRNFIVEFGVKNLNTSFERFDQDVLNGALVFQVITDRKTRKERNARRTRNRVPEENLDYYLNEVTQEFHVYFKQNKMKLITLANINDLEYLKRKTLKYLLNFKSNWT